MSSQIAVNSIDALKDLRVAMALYGEETLGALGAIGAELRRTVYWLQQERPAYWQDQIKRRREKVSSAKAELFRRQLSKTSGSTPSTTEQVENLRRAEASLEDAERRLMLTRKWQSQLNQAILEYHASTRRIKTLASGEVPGAVNLLTRLIDALEDYLRLSAPSGSGTASASAGSTSVTTPPPAFEAIATKMIDDEPPPDVADSEESPESMDEESLPVGDEPPA